MAKTLAKPGRPQAAYRPKSGGPRVVGLMRLGDGRWRASGPEKYTFSEPDEMLAIAQFRRWQAGKSADPIGTVSVHGNALDVMWEIKRRTDAAGGGVQTTIARLENADGSTKAYAVVDETLSPTQWAWLRRQIVERPKWVAEHVGIEEIGYLQRLRKPTAIPSFASLAQTWELHFDSSREQKRKCPIAFAEFRRVTRVATVTDITAEVAVRYRDHVYARDLSGKTQSNIFTRIRRYLAFFRDRAIAVDEMNQALAYLALLTPNQTTVTLDPRPIEVTDWQRLEAAAKDENKAMVLLMLNCAMYLQEVIKLRWDEIHDGCVATHRAKTGRCVRVAVLWPETLAALEAVPRRGEYVFHSRTGEPLGISGAEARFRALRERAKVDTTSSQLRDGAYTAAVEANVTSNLCQLLVGHRSGIADHYVKRRPSMVAPACRAVYEKYVAA